ncbi:MAG: tripartite tricarboxylate transporter substrate binding protein [Alphaproteobacteria bacterium]|nr:tripartite tricarboxylate transporter substrate binding protein [Alphaproteobacteria bacterium]
MRRWMHLPFAALAMATALAAGAVQTSAQDYPARPVRIVVGFPAGAAGDLVSRVMAAHLSHIMGQQFLVENRPGASSNIATEQAARAEKDGYTLFLGTVANVVNAAVSSKLSFDFARDFAPIALIATVPVALVVHPSTGARNVNELLSVAKSKPGQLNYASSGVATTPHLAGALMNVKAGVQLVHVPYQGSAPAMTDLVAGRTHVMFSAVSVVMPHIRSGALRALALAAPKRSNLLPNLPTVAEVGLPELDASIWFGLMAPAGTPQPILNRLGAAINALLKSDAVSAQLAAMGYEPLGGSAGDFTRYVDVELKKWTLAAEAAGVRN